MFAREFWEILKNNFFIEHLCWLLLKPPKVESCNNAISIFLERFLHIALKILPTQMSWKDFFHTSFFARTWGFLRDCKTSNYGVFFFFFFFFFFFLFKNFFILFFLFWFFFFFFFLFFLHKKIILCFFLSVIIWFQHNI